MKISLSIFPLTLLVALLGASSSAMACYTIYNAQNEMVYDRIDPPVNMSTPLHLTVPARLPGGALVFSTSDVNCSGLDTLNHYNAATPVAAAKAGAKMEREDKKQGLEKALKKARAAQAAAALAAPAAPASSAKAQAPNAQASAAAKTQVLSAPALKPPVSAAQTQATVPAATKPTQPCKERAKGATEWVFCKLNAV